MREDGPDPIDVHVGENIKKVRGLKGITQRELAERSGVMFQQIQKYEAGHNRVSCSRLVMIAKSLGVPPAVLFGKYSGKNNPEIAVINNRQAIRYINDFNNLDDEERKLLHSFMRTLKKIRAQKAP